MTLTDEAVFSSLTHLEALLEQASCPERIDPETLEGLPAAWGEAAATLIAWSDQVKPGWPHRAAVAARLAALQSRMPQAIARVREFQSELAEQWYAENRRLQQQARAYGSQDPRLLSGSHWEA